VPFALWCAAHSVDRFEEALWLAVSVPSNRDTHCAIAGGIAALLAGGVPPAWIQRCEPLPGERSAPAPRRYISPARTLPHANGLADRPIHPGPAGKIDSDLDEDAIHLDALTGLPNLAGMLEWVTYLSEEDISLPCSLLAVHLVALWQVNRSQGRTAGDELLRSVAGALEAQATGPLFRAGGDKFVVALFENERSWTLDQAHRLAAITRVEGLKPARAALIHFTEMDQLTPGKLLACLYVALADRYFKNNTGSPREFSAAEILEMDDFPWMMLDLADQLQRISSTAAHSLRLAQTDSISQLPNMRAAIAALESAAGQARSYDQTLAVLMIDGDNLRQYNEISYEAGDEAIRLLGSTLKEQLRETDFLARWRTGDEFLVLLHNASHDQALQVGQRLCDAVAHASQSWLFPTTISIGVGYYPEDGPTVQDLLHHAEQCLEKAKHSGKNKVEM
jgi:diguanylate cyclase (GGDEF)-like protein